MEIVLLISAYFIASIVGASPLGLVNLTVLDVSHRKGISSAMQMAGGASLIEILFVLIAILSGGIITLLLQTNAWVRWFFVIVPVLTGIFFFFKKNNVKSGKESNQPAFIRGAILNLISIQVLLYWIFFFFFIKQNKIMTVNVMLLLITLTTVWLGKMMVLWGYAKLSKLVLSKFRFLATQINRVIGIILILAGLMQYLKM
ncbi:MAG: hypothetical protein MI866_09455 [Bacteroidales bacterium]|nr:hypothetical protein [Bacteroidales bacterium]